MVAICRRDEKGDGHNDSGARVRLGPHFPDVTFVHLSFTLSGGFSAAPTVTINQPAVRSIADVARDVAHEQPPSELRVAIRRLVKGALFASHELPDMAANTLFDIRNRVEVQLVANDKMPSQSASGAKILFWHNVGNDRVMWDEVMEWVQKTCPEQG